MSFGEESDPGMVFGEGEEESIIDAEKYYTNLRHEIFPEFRIFHDLRGHSRGNRRSDLIFMGGGGGVPYILCAR